MWRPRASGRKLRLEVVTWPSHRLRRKDVAEQAERLAAYRGLTLAGVDMGA